MQELLAVPENPQADKLLETARSLDIEPGTPCTEFVSKTLIAAGYKVTREARAMINIDIASIDRSGYRNSRGLPLGAYSLPQLVLGGFNAAKGVVFALSQTGQGTEIPVSEAKPGDPIQYWYQKESGALAGHTAIISKVRSPGFFDIYGSHRTDSTNPEKPPFVGTLEGVNLNGAVKAFVVRPRPVFK